MSPPRPPAHLQSAGKALYLKITAEWEQGTHELLLLESAAVQFDTSERRFTLSVGEGTSTTADSSALRV